MLALNLAWKSPRNTKYLRRNYGLIIQYNCIYSKFYRHLHFTIFFLKKRKKDVNCIPDVMGTAGKNGKKVFSRTLNLK